jgi:putative MFS transporter
LLIVSMVLAAIAAPSISIAALLGALPLALAVLAIAVFGVETRKKQLETITAEELVGIPPA